MALDAKQWRILSICLFPVITLSGIFLAAFLGGRDTTNKLAFSMGVMFSSGVLLAAALVHALPKSQQLFKALQRERSAGLNSQEDEHQAKGEEWDARFLQQDEENEDYGFPWASTLFGSSFLLLMCIEAMTERFVDRYIGQEVAGSVLYAHGHDHVGKRGGDHAEQVMDNSCQLEVLPEENHQHEQEVPSNEVLNVKQTQREKQSEEFSPTEAPNQRSPPSTPVMVRAGSAAVRQTANTMMTQHASGAGEFEESVTASSEEIRGRSAATAAPSLWRPNHFGNLHHDHSPRRRSSSIRANSNETLDGHPAAFNPDDFYLDSTYLVTANVNDIQDLDEKQTINPWVAVVLLIVLSIHVLIEGIVLGSTQTVEVIESTFIAIVFHKGFSAFALGSSLVTSGYWDKGRPGGRCMFYILAGMYAFVDIFGIGTGMALSHSFHADSYANACLQALLGGSFLFVATAELIPGELEKMRVFQFPVALILFPLLLGYALMTIIGIWV